MSAINLINELMGDEATAAADSVDAAAASSGTVPPGKYHVRLEECKSKDAGEIAVEEMMFVILAGPFAGRKLKYQLWMGTKTLDKDGNEKAPDKLKSDQQMVINEFWHSAGALGLAIKKKGADGKEVYAKVQGKRDFRDMLGAECFCESIVRSGKGKDGTDMSFAEIKKFGLHRLDDPKFKDVARAGKGGSVTVATGKPPITSKDLSDLV